MFTKVVIVGVGLIGGSFALGLKAAGAVGHVVGLGRSAQALARARELGIIDEAATSPQDAMRGADLVLLAAPVAQTGPILSSLLPYLEPQTIVTDAGSTKSDVVAAARAALGDRVHQFVPGHPIAGRESNGPDAAIPDLYRGKKTVLAPLPENTPEAIDKVAAAWRTCGAVIHQLTAEEHDKVFAAVSHLPHLLAYALVDDIANKPHADLLFQYAASGFRDFTRLASSDPTMWRDVCLHNKDAILEMLARFSEDLASLQRAIRWGEGDKIFELFTRTRAIRRSIVEAGQDVDAPDFGRHALDAKK